MAVRKREKMSLHDKKCWTAATKRVRVNNVPFTTQIFLNMKSMPLYENKVFTIGELIQGACPSIGEPLIAIPNIQRPYVWKPSQLAKLVDSLMHGWPCGNLLFWDINHQQQQIFATRKFTRGHKSTSSSCEGRENVDEGDFQYLILDGQQRVQSLVIALSPWTEGYTTTEKNWVKDDNPKSDRSQTETVTRFLCFDLTRCTSEWLNSVAKNAPSFFYLDYEENADIPLLVWKTQNEIDGQNIVRLSDVAVGHYPDTEAGKWLNQEVERLLRLPIAVMSVNRVAAEEDADLDDDEAVVQIFTRLNTAGTPLTKEQIQSAKINSLWADFPDSIESLQHELRQFPFSYDFDADDIVKGFNIVLLVKHGATTMTEVYKKQAESAGDNVNEVWKSDWTRFRNAMRLVLSTLQDKGLHYKSEYQSLYVVWFSVAALCKWNLHNTEELDEELTNLMVKYAIVSTWARIWANRSGQFVKSYTESLRTGDEEDIVTWFKNRLRDPKLVTPAINSVSDLAASHRGSVRQYYLYLWVWSRLNEERANTLAKFVEDNDSFDVDHIVPISWIDTPDQKPTFNSIGNCWLLASAANGAKSNDSMQDFLNGEAIGLAIGDLVVPLDCSFEHLAYEQNGENINDVINSISARTNRMKEELKMYIEKDSLSLFYPQINLRANQGGEVGLYGFYREDEFKNSKYFRVSPSSAKQYLRGIKTIINKLGLTDEELSNCQNNPQLRNDWKTNTLVQNSNRSYKTGWGKYLNFLFDGNEVAAGNTMGGRIGGNTTAMHDGQLETAAQDGECARALNRLPNVLQRDSITKRAIINALGKGCTATNWVYRSQILDEEVKETNISAMLSEVGNASGRYFISQGRGEDCQLRFAEPVWNLLKILLKNVN